jgi:hypothetical protein
LKKVVNPRDSGWICDTGRRAEQRWRLRTLGPSRSTELDR